MLRPNYLGEIYVEANKEIISKLKSIVSQYNKSVYRSYQKQTIKGWVNKKCWVPLNVIKKLYNLSDKTVWDFVDGFKIKGASNSAPIKFKKKVTPAIAVIFGWIASDGYISNTINQVSISQSNFLTLDRLKQIILNNFNIKPQHVTIRSVKDNRPISKNQQYILTINSNIFKKLLVKYYGFLVGKDKKKQLPKCILHSTADIKKAFIASFLEGDGNIYWLGHRARVMITCKHRRLSEQIKKIGAECGYKLNIIHNRKKKCYVLQTHQQETIVKMIVNSVAYLVNPNKINNISQIIESDDFFKRLRTVQPQEYRHNLIVNAMKNMSGKTRQERFNNLTDILRSEVNFNLNVNTVRGPWKYLNYKMPLGAFIKLHELTGQDYNRLITDWHQKFIDLHKGACK